MLKHVSFPPLPISSRGSEGSDIGPFSKKNKKFNPDAKTIRLEIDLSQASGTFPEYSYLELVESSKGDKGNNEESNPFGSDEDDSKFGSLISKYVKGSKKNKGFLEDYIDKGMGYDETDPFIDNSEAYDELIPSTITTQHGGFYINMGRLEFKAIEQQQVKPSSSHQKQQKSSESSKSQSQNKPQPKPQNSSQPKPQPSSQTQSQLQTVSPPQQTPRLLNQPQSQHQIQPKSQHHPQVHSQSQSQPQQLNQQSQSQAQTHAQTHSPSPPQPQFQSQIQSQPQPQSQPSPKPQIHNQSQTQLQSQAQPQSQSQMQQQQQPISLEPPRLPDNIPDQLTKLLQTIKTMRLSYRVGKKKFFDENVNKTLLHIENICETLSPKSRTQVYAYASFFLPCTKDTLLKRVKKLKREYEERESTETLHLSNQPQSQHQPQVHSQSQSQPQQLNQQSQSQAHSPSSPQPQSQSQQHTHTEVHHKQPSQSQNQPQPHPQSQPSPKSLTHNQPQSQTQQQSQAQTQSRSPLQVNLVKQTKSSKLPDNLPSRLLKFIQMINHLWLAHNSKDENFFDHQFDKKLLAIEKNCSRLDRKIRLSVYDYLASFLPFSRITLLNRIKRLQSALNFNKLNSQMRLRSKNSTMRKSRLPKSKEAKLS